MNTNKTESVWRLSVFMDGRGNGLRQHYRERTNAAEALRRWQDRGAYLVILETVDAAEVTGPIRDESEP